jgi:hypothetical protein
VQLLELADQLLVEGLVLEQLEHDLAGRQRQRVDVEQEAARDVDPRAAAADQAPDPDVAERAQQDLGGRAFAVGERAAVQELVALDLLAHVQDGLPGDGDGGAGHNAIHASQ